MEAQRDVERHLSIKMDKPCVAAYFAGQVWPEVGERAIMFYSLAAELRRMGQAEERAQEIIQGYYEKMPVPLREGQGSDARPFSNKEALRAVKTAYRGEKAKSYGCNSHIWDKACAGEAGCFFRKQLKTGHRQSHIAQHYAFLSWLGVKTLSGRPLLKGATVKVYFGIQLVERRRGYKAGAQLYVSWRELAELSGVAWRHIGEALENLTDCGLIHYAKGIASQRGKASEVRRAMPVPTNKGYDKMS